ncbi:hypothetical protein [Bradyrhizobium sp. URHC0002]
MPILKNNKHELFAHPDYHRARWRRRHGKPGRLDRSFSSGRWRSVVDDKFYADLASKMDDGELNTIANELLEGIRRDGESRREHLEMLSEGFKALGLVIETATATSVSSSAPLEGMSAVRHPLLLEACSLFRANAMGEMLPAAGPVKVRDDRPQKPKSADMMGHNDRPALDGTNPFSTPPAPQAPAQATPGIPTPARRRRSRRQSPASSRCRRDAPSATADCRPAPAMGAPAAPGPKPGAGPGASWRRPSRQRPSFRKSKSATRSRTSLKRT